MKQINHSEEDYRQYFQSLEEEYRKNKLNPRNIERRLRDNRKTIKVSSFVHSKLVEISTKEDSSVSNTLERIINFFEINNKE